MALRTTYVDTFKYQFEAEGKSLLKVYNAIKSSIRENCIIVEEDSPNFIKGELKDPKGNTIATASFNLIQKDDIILIKGVTQQFIKGSHIAWLRKKDIESLMKDIEDHTGYSTQNMEKISSTASPVDTGACGGCCIVGTLYILFIFFALLLL